MWRRVGGSYRLAGWRDLDIWSSTAGISTTGKRNKFEARVEATGPLCLVATPGMLGREKARRVPLHLHNTSLPPPTRSCVDHGRRSSVGNGTRTGVVLTGTNGAVMEG